MIATKPTGSRASDLPASTTAVAFEAGNGTFVATGHVPSATVPRSATPTAEAAVDRDVPAPLARGHGHPS